MWRAGRKEPSLITSHASKGSTRAAYVGLVISGHTKTTVNTVHTYLVRDRKVSTFRNWEFHVVKPVSSCTHPFRGTRHSLENSVGYLETIRDGFTPRKIIYEIYRSSSDHTDHDLSIYVQIYYIVLPLPLREDVQDLCTVQIQPRKYTCY